ncbi:unnamed protein product [Paramecium primaurelia]|uniref:Uncharacterized protein n=1 Tax=Paramecium primaurelia TaxID=5886 RepID=A0A8S1PD00_PARPR|nr:unnamed protein product [Paramecium primaurelia]
MVLISFIKILFLNPILLNQDCVELPGADCLNNGWTNAHNVISCQGIIYMGQFTGGRRISKTFWCPSENLMRLSFTIAKFDSWDGESVFVYKDNVLIGQITYAPFDGTKMCLGSYYPDLMEKKSYQFMLPKGQNFANFNQLIIYKQIMKVNEKYCYCRIMGNQRYNFISCRSMCQFLQRMQFLGRFVENMFRKSDFFIQICSFQNKINFYFGWYYSLDERPKLSRRYNLDIHFKLNLLR